MKINELLGKTVIGVVTANLSKDGTEADSVTLKFADGSQLQIGNEYLEGFGWTVLYLNLKENEPL